MPRTAADKVRALSTKRHIAFDKIDNIDRVSNLLALIERIVERLSQLALPATLLKGLLQIRSVRAAENAVYYFLKLLDSAAFIRYLGGVGIFFRELLLNSLGTIVKVFPV